MVHARNEGRVEALLPRRHHRMSSSPFTFYRGTAELMAFDLSHQTQTGTQIVICGDAHISNFGLYASPERRLIFDLNDFDEAAPGPWEWDVKRMVTSAILAARENGFSPEEQERIARVGAKAYKDMLRELLEIPALQRHYYSVDSTKLAETVREDGRKKIKRTTQKALRRDSDRAIEHLMAPDAMGFIRFRDDPPILTHLSERDEQMLVEMYQKYAQSTTPDIKYLLSRFTLSDVARRIVGVGSVGTRCFVSALTGPEDRGIMLQVKEATESVVTKYSAPNITTPPTIPEGMSMGERVTSHQQILQSVSDPFLGHVTAAGRDYYVRQFRDAKGSFDTSNMNVAELVNYVALCGGILARAHSQSPRGHLDSIGRCNTEDSGVVVAERKYSDEQKRAVLAAVDRGSTVRAAAVVAGVSPDAGYRWVKQAGLSTSRSAPRKYTTEEKKRFYSR